MKNKTFLSIILACSLFVFVLLLDLLTKGLIIPKLIPNVGDTVSVLPGFINFVYVQNKGAAWGMLAGRPVFLIVISIIVLGLLIAFYVLRLKKFGKTISPLFGICIGLIAGGCIGNLLDRLVFGYVRDFINFQFIDFPVFNFADVALTLGVIIMLVYFIFFYTKEEEKLKYLTENSTNSTIFAQKNDNFNENNRNFNKNKEILGTEDDNLENSSAADVDVLQEDLEDIRKSDVENLQENNGLKNGEGRDER